MIHTIVRSYERTYATTGEGTVYCDEVGRKWVRDSMPNYSTGTDYTTGTGCLKGKRIGDKIITRE